VFIVELLTKDGRVCERWETYEEARRRVERFPVADLLSLPLIFQELADGSQRLVREDGKPLQWHRLPEDRAQQVDEPVTLSEGNSGLFGPDGQPRLVERTPQDDWDDDPIPF
jgi:hypothetical protein